MSTKEDVLAILKKSGTHFHSGQEIAGQLYVTRAAVWKAVKALEKDGISIEAVTNRGYRLAEQPAALDAEKIRSELEKMTGGRNAALPEIRVFDRVTSTNDLAREYADQAENEREIVWIAGQQTAGRGRRGRSFYSPAGTGIYMSFLQYPHVEFSKAVQITCMMAVALCRAVDEVCGVETQIKWVNDIYCGDKKTAGILTEGKTSFEDGSLSYVIVGAGLNMYFPYEGFPEEIRKTAGSLLSEQPDAEMKNRLCAAVIRSFLEICRDPDGSGFREEYKRRSMLIGHYVKILSYQGNEKQKGHEYALVTGIDDDCRLLIRHDDGREEALSSGEVSVVRY